MPSQKKIDELKESGNKRVKEAGKYSSMVKLYLKLSASVDASKFTTGVLLLFSWTGSKVLLKMAESFRI